MFRPRQFGVLVALGILALGFADRQWLRADGETPTPAPTGATRVRITRMDGGKIEGTLTTPKLEIQTSFGNVTLDMNRVKEIDISEGTNPLEAVVELTDESHLDGKLLTESLTVQLADGQTETLDAAAVRSLQMLRPVDTSVLAIVLGLVTLTAMEIVLGVDNVIFLTIIAARLPKHQQPKARKIGLGAALGTRILLLFSLSFLLSLNQPFFSLPVPMLAPDARDISWRDIILLAGGVFLIGKSVKEMHHKLEEARKHREGNASAEGSRVTSSFLNTILYIAVIDIVFSLDSVITAVGMVDVLWVMIVAMIIAMLVMLISAESIAVFVDKHPTVKMLALSFLILIGVLLVAESMGQHISKGYIYFAMGFAVIMEFINMRLRPRVVPPEETVAANPA